MKIVTENSTGQLITNCMRQHFNAKFDTAYYKLPLYLYMIHFKVLKHISNHFNFLLQTINELDKLYTKTNMYTYYFRIPHIKPSLFVLKFCISSCFQKLFRKYSVIPIVYAERGQTASVLWGTQIIASYVCILSYFHRPKQRKSSSSEAEPANTCNRKFYPKYLNELEEEWQQQHFAFVDV